MALPVLLAVDQSMAVESQVNPRFPALGPWARSMQPFTSFTCAHRRLQVAPLSSKSKKGDAANCRKIIKSSGLVTIQKEVVKERTATTAISRITPISRCQVEHFSNLKSIHYLRRVKEMFWPRLGPERRLLKSTLKARGNLGSGRT